jgi:putative DNA methylase
LKEPTKRKLIEVALPLEAINVASAREKSIRHGHPSTLHLWWARRPLAACRAVLFASLVDDPSSHPERYPTSKAVEDERTRLFGIIERLVRWENSTNTAVLHEARAEILRSTNGEPPSILDPFCGGGSIPLEAQRLGLTAYASDLNPVAVLITKALIEIPPKYRNLPPVHPDARAGVGGTGTWFGAAGLAEDIRRYGAWMRGEAERRIGRHYPTISTPTGPVPADAWIWARNVRCPNPACAGTTPLVGSFALSTKAGREAWARPVPAASERRVLFRVESGPEALPGNIGRRGASCLICGAGMTLAYVREEGRAGRIGTQLMATVARVAGVRTFLDPTASDEDAASAAHPEWGPDEDASTHPQYMGPPRYGFRRFRDMFTNRQLVALSTFSELVMEARERVLADVPPDGTDARDAAAYADAVATYLALAVDRGADYWSMSAVWAGEFVAHTFGRNDLPMVWDFAEAAPLGDSSGNWNGAIDWIARVVKDLPASGTATVVQADAANLASTGSSVVSTDPPYYDNVPFSDLSDFFYVWLRRSVRSIWPELFDTVLTPKSNELVADSQRFGGRSNAAREFESRFRSAFDAVRVLSRPEFPTTIFYAFKQTESETSVREDSNVASTAWETMLEGLFASGYSIVGTWPIRTERPGRLRQSRSNALASSVVLVCRPRPLDSGITTRKDFVASLNAEMPEALRTLQHGNIAPVDLAQSAIGPGMAIYSRHAKVLEPDGTPMRVRTALALVNQVLDEILAEQEGDFDSDTRWAIAWYEQFGLKDAEFGVADVLARAKNTSVPGLSQAGIVTSARGRVRLLARDEYDIHWDPVKDRRTPVWEATQRLVHVLLTGGEASAAELLSRLGGLGDVARDLAYRLYQVADRKGWTDEARAYNSLVVAWTDLARGADSAGAGAPGQRTLGLGE